MYEQAKIHGFEWSLQIVNADGSIACEETKCNIIPSDGLSFLARAPFGDVTPISTFYLGLFRGNYIPTFESSALDIPGAMNEMVDYSEPNRPEWVRSLNGIATMDNVNSKAEYTITQDRTIYGAFLVSSATKASNTGLLLSCVRFSSPKQVTAGQTVTLAGGLTYTSSKNI